MKEVTKEVYLKWYEDMLLWKFEDKLAALYIQQKLDFFTFIQRSEAVLAALHAMDLTKIK
jgi:pyruvate dehydrogenase E1 component alpha subunit